MALIWDTDTYNNAYSRYNHQWVMDMDDFGLYKHAFQKLVSRNLYTPADEVLFVGCGFGYWMEYLFTINGVDPDNVWGIDNGPHINTNKNNSVYVNDQAPLAGGGTIDLNTKILDLDITSPTILDDLKPAFGGNGKVGGWVMSTLTLTSLQSDQEIQDFANSCDNIKGPQGQVGHIFTSELTTGTDPADPHDRSFGMNWQHRDYWRFRLANHWLFDQHGWNHTETKEFLPDGITPNPQYVGKYGVDYFGIYNPDLEVWQ